MLNCINIRNIIYYFSTDVKLERRVIGGLKAGEAQFPFLGYLEYSGGLWCAVSIIHKRWLLTAAHCLDMYELFYFNGTVKCK